MKKYVLWLLTLLTLTSQAQTIVKQRITFSLNGVLTEGKIHRNYELYPATSAGDQAVRAAVESGTVSVTLTSGYRAGAVAQAYVTRPPSTTAAPPAASWLSQARYSFGSDNLLYVEANGEAGMQLAFGFSGTNPDNVNIVSGTYYGYGSNVNSGYPYQWKVYKQAAGATSLTFRRSSSSSENVTYQVTPTPGQTNVSLTGGSSTAPPSTTATEFQTPAVSGTGVQLTINCASSTARIVGKLSSGSTIGVYLFRDNVLVGSRDNLAGPNCDVTLTGVSGNGTYKARVFELGNDGNALTSPNLVVSCGSTTTPPPSTTVVGPNPVSGTLAQNGGFAEGSLSELFALAPFAPSQNQLGSWADRSEQVLENEFVRVSIHKSLSGGIYSVVDKRTGVNQINTLHRGHPDNPDLWDLGRSFDYGAYGGPFGANVFPFYNSDRTQNTSQTGDDTGWNPIPIGSRYENDHGALQYFQRQNVSGYGDVLYVNTQGKQWSMQNVPTEWNRHAFLWLEGRSLRWIFISQNYRTDNQRKWQGRQQESPYLYMISVNYQHKAEFGNGVQDFYSPEPYSDNGQGGNHPFNTSTGIRVTSSPYMGTYNPATGYGLTLVTPWNTAFEGKQFGNRTSDYWGSNESGYMAAAPRVDQDTPSNQLVSGYCYVGRYDEFRNWYNSAGIPLRPFSYDFTGGKFQGWSSSDCEMKNVGGVTTFYLGGAKPYNASERGAGKLVSPFGAWPASQMAIKLDAAIEGTNQIEVLWRKPGQSEVDAAPQRQVFSVTGDGQRRTYTFTPNYGGGTISQIVLGMASGSSANGSEVIRLYSISN